ncbi:MAG: PAS domain S-box protein [Bacteroidales bacterium]|nr:PAS domain S-box protein [Bacteroidales bacterium]
MASRIVLLVTNKVLPSFQFEPRLDGMGYSLITLDRVGSDVELPAFDLAIVGVADRASYNAILKVFRKYPEKPLLFYSGKNTADAQKSIPELDSTNHVNPDFTNHELSLQVELAITRKWFDHSSIFSDGNAGSNHVRLKKILSEEQAWRVLFEQSPNGVLLSDSAGSIIFTNNATSEILGYSSSELLKMRFHDLVPPETLPQVDQNIKKILAGERLITEVYNLRKDGSKRFVQLHESRVLFPSGEFGIMVVSIDMTRAKKAEDALGESLEKYRILVEQSNDGIIYSKDGIITYGNPRIAELLEVQHCELVGKPFYTYLPKSEWEKLQNRYKNRLEGIKEPSIYETLLVSAHGSNIPVELNVNLATIGNERVTMVVVRDISLRKEAEKAIRESEESYRGLFNNSGEAIYIIDASGILLDVNPSGLKLFGKEKEETLGLTLMELADQEKSNTEEVKRKIRIAHQGQTQYLEFWGKKSNGDRVPMDIVLSKGTYFGLQVVLAIGHDITERKNAEAILRESEDKFRTLTEQIPVGIYRLTPEGKILYGNPAFAKTLGFNDTSEVIGHSMDEFIATNYDDWVEESVKLSPGAPAEQSFRRQDGINLWANNQLRRVKNASGEVDYLDGVLVDITEHKFTLDALKESEERFRAMVTAIPDRLFRINADGDLIDFAPSEQLLDFELNAGMIGHSLSEFLPQDVFQKFTDAISLAKQSGKLQTFEYKFSKNNQDYFNEVRLLQSGRSLFLVLQRDITQKKQFEAQANMLAQTIMTANDSISITNTDGHFIFVNPAFTKTYGYTQSEIIGKHTSILKTPDRDLTLDKTIHEETLKGGWQGELINVRKDGAVFPIFLSTSAVYDENGIAIAHVGIANDITERKKIEQELIRAKEKAEESDRLKTAFLSNMSHEIRSPMNAVLGFTQLIKSDEQLSETGMQYIELIQNSGKQLLSLLEDIIDISKIQSNQLRIDKNAFDLNELMDELYLIFSNQLKLKDECKTLLFKPEKTCVSPFVIYSDPVRIKQILSNLLSNAIKFTPSGSINFGYSIFSDDDASKIQFYVRDTGIGISIENQLLIFERFRQADNSYTRLYGGSGLGLAISRGLVELLGGDIWVESKPGEGSEFFFNIPLEFSEKDTPAPVQPSSEVKQPVSQLKGKTVLVVEDVNEIRLYFERVLERTGAKILFAKNAKEARKLFKSNNRIRLVLLDIGLSDADGFELAVEFKRMRPNTPIIAQTAYALQSELNRSIESGCDDYITKPLDSAVLIGKMLRLIGSKSQQSD